MAIQHIRKIGQHPLDQGLLNNALGFFNGGSRCLAEIRISPILINSPMAPAITCFAFSLELYLKLLHVITTEQAPRGHGLHELFVALPEQTRNSLNALYGEREISGDIASISDAFVSWRYEHEHNSLEIRPAKIIKIVQTCHKLVRELRPDLTVFGENNCLTKGCPA